MARSAVMMPIQPQAAATNMTVRSKIEHELKLSVDNSFHLPSLPGTPISRRLLTSIYYDTPEYDLTHAGITFRHRSEHGTHAWQLKLPLIKDRLEIELADRGPEPPAILRDLLVLHIGQRQLAPVATLRTWRTGVRIHQNEVPIADVTIDQVSVMSDGSAIERFREVEVEQLDGEDTTLRDIERDLRRAGADDHDGRPKLFRALSLPLPAVDAPPGPDAPVVEHVTRALARHVRWLVTHDPGTRLGHEPESLHQMRVACRQLRAVLHAAKPLLVPEWADALRKEISWLAQLLGPARDLDVQLAYFRNESTQLNARDRKPLARFIAHLESQRAKVQAALASELQSRRYLDLIGRLRSAAQHPAVAESTLTLRDLAAREFKKLRKVIEKVGASPSSTKIHEIRIKTKRARYAADLATPAVGKPAARFIKTARTLQDVLGMHQDAIQAEAHVRAFVTHSKSLGAAFVAGRMVERQRERRDQARQCMSSLWKKLLKRGKQAWES